VRGFDRFIDIQEKSNREAAALARSLNLDIAVDLGGHTYNARPGIFALRAAPLQISYLGYLGTLGANYIDYLIGDRTVVTPQSAPFFTEKVVYLPDSFQVNDRKRPIADRVFSRAELGLPERGCVFCCFNGSYKIHPETFASWMRILQRVPGSVLLLVSGDEAVALNLRGQAARQGVDPQRLIFAGRLPPPEYLARYRTADLFLDTLPYNAGTTASDALWAGLPVLTLAGNAYAGRVAASLLTAVGLPELVTKTRAEYEDLAFELAMNPPRLARLKETLARNRLTSALFDTGRFARNLEAAYLSIHDRHQAGLPPDDVTV
jgi:predicted O-linked N-acetylglucosamine transferase (SPINDLY family)